MFALLESAQNLLQNPYNITHFTLGMLLHYPAKVKNSIFCRHSADMEENANKFHFRCTYFNSSMRVTVYAECIYVFYQNIVLVTEYHVNC